MSAGKPDWAKLHQLGKLPKNADAHVPLLAELNEAKARIEKIYNSVCEDCKKVISSDDSKKVSVPCEMARCDFIAKGATEAMANNYLRLHMKTHITVSKA